ncbi:MAG: aldehyde reductase [Pseudomonadota bacterium]
MPNAQVLVTGATGFIGQHVIVQLLEKGYTVRGTLRSLAKADGVRAAIAAQADASGLELVALDLTSDDGWQDAMAGVQFVQHVASPFPLAQPKDPNELIVPARDGALRALRFAKAAGVSRVVLTSSMAAIGYGLGDNRPKLLDETIWAPTEMVDDHTAYSLSKTIAEKSAWDFIDAEGGLELAVVNPVLVLGPMVGRDTSSSLEVIQQLMTGLIPAYPDFGFGVVDVRDIAELHLLAMESPEAAGERFLGTSDFMHVREIGEAIRAAFPNNSAKVPTRDMPSWLLRILGRFMPSVRPIIPELGRRREGTSAKAQAMLGWAPRSGKDAVVAAAGDLIEKGFV